MSETAIQHPDGAPATALPSYEESLARIKTQVNLARTRAMRAVNEEMLRAYWQIGKEILRRQDDTGNRRGRAGVKIVQRLSTDLRAAFPDMTGFSVTNLRYMRAFAAAWPEERMLQHGVGALPWGHILVLLDGLEDRTTREWYAVRAGGWTRNVLQHHIATRLHEREGAVLSNFDETFDADDAQLVLRDPVLVEFVAGAGGRERELEDALVADVARFMHALGDGFLYAGRQYVIDIGEGSEFRLDLLFYHHPTSRWVVIDLKTGPFRAEYTGKMNAYVNAVDELVARGGDKPTVGFILCAEHRRAEARFALRGMATPLAVGRYVTGERGVETADEPAGISDGLEGELVRLARVEQRLARFAAERAAVLGAGTDRGG